LPQQQDARLEPALLARPGQPIPVGREPLAIAITPDGRTAYVVSFTSGTVTPINTATNTPERPIHVGHGAFTIVITG